MALGLVREFVRARTPTEERGRRIWADVLDVDRVSVTETFFDLGGDSMRAVRLAGSLRDAGFAVSVRDVFDHHSVAELCEFVTGRPAPAKISVTAPFD